ncbi:2Fe-2S iron-sulfur cluster-binding protein [Govanella unica]|uniref:2Fe-2S iron-sulfur cluster binding domain-containing protein n=1 Tax=Govanella unica TaxID=2975056 RepID=A0A9X3U0T7_9PROT|nr:2Fe-2S iron-sulfur cluster binding domain-containing protein [Govania unica]MDA5195038.1 2Fe-2S iron-sulfur cluster binding domain-containing protein [Govania unica]
MTAPIYKVKVLGAELLYACPEDQTLMRAMGWSTERSVPIGCRKGACGVCRIKILSGAFETSSQASRHITVEDATQGYVLGCRTRPNSDLVIDIPAGTQALIKKSAKISA